VRGAVLVRVVAFGYTPRQLSQARCSAADRARGGSTSLDLIETGKGWDTPVCIARRRN